MTVPRQHGSNTAIIACGALAREIRAVLAANHLEHIDLHCLPAGLHNRPERIAAAVEAKVIELRACYDRLFCAYADCGTGGALDAVLARHGIQRLPGAHCYAFYTGLDAFAAFAEDELGTFYLTDFLARQFDTLVIEGLKLDKHPELMPMIFGHYRRLVYLAQSDDPTLDAKARAAAERLELTYERRYTGYGLLQDALTSQLEPA